jgi:hypothetical protein
MKILFLTSPFPNFVPDLLLHGLRKLMDSEVIDFPRKDSLYKGDLVGFSPAGQCNHPFFPQDENRIDRTDIPRKIASGYFRYVICDLRIFPRFLQTIHEIPKGCVVVDGEDQPQTVPLGPYVVCRRETDGSDFSIPLPISLPEEVMDWIQSYDSNPKEYSVGFLGSFDERYRERKEIAEAVSKWYEDCLFNVCAVPPPNGETPDGWVSRDLYYSNLQKCRVLLNVRGAGYDTFRFWENAACNAVQVSQEMPLYIPNAFEHGIHLLRFSCLTNLRKNIDQVLEEKIDTPKMIRESRDHLLKYHTSQARALYLLDRLEKIL